MIFIDGFPRASGVTDMADSVVIAGLMAQVGHIMAPDLSLYVNAFGECVRCPVNDRTADSLEFVDATDPKNFTRDQLICLVGGLRAQNQIDEIVKIHSYLEKRKWFTSGGDYLAPHHRAFIRKCADFGAPTWFEDFCFYADIFAGSVLDPMHENNQILSMLWGSDLKFLNYYLKRFPKWDIVAREYWFDRKEFDLPDQMVKKTNSLAKRFQVLQSVKG